MTEVNRHLLVLLGVMGLVVCGPAYAETSVRTSGEPKKWHKLTLTFDGPETSETDEFNPFLNYRLNVRFTHPASGKSYLVPGSVARLDTGAPGPGYRPHVQLKLGAPPDSPDKDWVILVRRITAP